METIPKKLKAFKSSGAEVVRAVKKVHSTGKEARRILIVAQSGTVLCTEKDKKVRRYFQYREISTVICQENSSGTIQILVKLLPPEYDILLLLSKDSLNGKASTWDDAELIINAMKKFYKGDPSAFQMRRGQPPANLSKMASLKKPNGYLPPAEKVKKNIETYSQSSPRSSPGSPRSASVFSPNSSAYSGGGFGSPSSPATTREAARSVFALPEGHHDAGSPPGSPRSQFNQQQPTPMSQVGQQPAAAASPAASGGLRSQSPVAPASPVQRQPVSQFNSPPTAAVSAGSPPSQFNPPPTGYQQPAAATAPAASVRPSGSPPSQFNSPPTGYQQQPAAPAASVSPSPRHVEVVAPRPVPTAVASPSIPSSYDGSKVLTLISRLGQELGLSVSETPEGLMLNDPTASTGNRFISTNTVRSESLPTPKTSTSTLLPSPPPRPVATDRSQQYDNHFKNLRQSSSLSLSPSTKPRRTYSYNDDALLQRRMAALERERKTLEQWEYNLNRIGRRLPA